MSNFPLVKSRLLLRVIIFVLLTLWTASFSNLIFTGYAGVLYPLADKCFSLMCHQDAERSFTFSGMKMLVCARCAGIYSGAALCSLVFLFPLSVKLPDRKFLLLAAVPLVTDVLLYNLGVYPYNRTISFATGLLLGTVVFIYILAALEKYFYSNE